MGSLYQSPNFEPTIHDLKVSIQDSSLVYPHQQPTHQSLFLSNIDQVLNFHVQTLHFFPPNPDFPPEKVAHALKTALQRLMIDPYDFLAGRFKMNPQTMRLELECNGGGVGFVVATSEYSLDKIGDLLYPNPAFTGLIIPGTAKFDDEPLCVIQITGFKCGGFVVAVSTNHGLFDGLSFKHFMQNLASQAFPDAKPLSIVPCNDRRLLAARSPPQVAFPHPELLELKLPVGQEEPPSPFDPYNDDLDFKIFRLTPDDITTLKERAKSGAKPGTKITGFNVITAHIWRCKALSNAADENRESKVLYAVDIRSRLQPPLPMSYCGNAVLTAYVSATCRELEAGPLGRLVEMVGEGAGRMTDEYARSVIDWGEVHKGFPNGEFLISSWWRLGFDEVEYPWGKPRYCCPLVYRRKDIILLFPDIGGANSNGVNVLVALPAKEMGKFESLFNTYLESSC